MRIGGHYRGTMTTTTTSGNSTLLQLHEQCTVEKVKEWIQDNFNEEIAEALKVRHYQLVLVLIARKECDNPDKSFLT